MFSWANHIGIERLGIHVENLGFVVVDPNGGV
jgi:hypothetical protein